MLSKFTFEKNKNKAKNIKRKKIKQNNKKI